MAHDANTHFIGRGRKRGIDIRETFERGNGRIGDNTSMMARGVLSMLALSIGVSPEALGTFLIGGAISYDGKRDRQATFSVWTDSAKGTSVVAAAKSFSLTPTRSSVYIEPAADILGYVVGDLRVTVDSKTSDDSVAVRVIVKGHLDDTDDTEEFVIYGNGVIKFGRPLNGITFEVKAGTESDTSLPSGAQLNIHLIAPAKLLDEDTADEVREVTATVHGREFRERMGNRIGGFMDGLGSKLRSGPRVAAGPSGGPAGRSGAAGIAARINATVPSLGGGGFGRRR